MKTILDVLTELKGLLILGESFYSIPEKTWDAFVLKQTQEYASDLTPDDLVSQMIELAKCKKPRVEDDLDSITAGSDSTQKVKIYYNSRTDTAEEIRKRIDTATEAVKLLKEKIGTTGK